MYCKSGPSARGAAIRSAAFLSATGATILTFFPSGSVNTDVSIPGNVESSVVENVAG